MPFQSEDFLTLKCIPDFACSIITSSYKPKKIMLIIKIDKIKKNKVPVTIFIESTIRQRQNMSFQCLYQFKILVFFGLHFID